MRTDRLPRQPTILAGRAGMPLQAAAPTPAIYGPAARIAVQARSGPGTYLNSSLPTRMTAAPMFKMAATSASRAEERGFRSCSDMVISWDKVRIVA